MNESPAQALRRIAYLKAIGVDSYVSRAQLDNAAPTQRYAVLRRVEPEPLREDIASLRAAAALQAPATPSPKHPGVQPPDNAVDSELRFSVAAVVAGSWLWLEHLGRRPLASEQVRLMQSMARALQYHRRDSAPPASADVAEFVWPLHDNRQLDQSAEAARAGLGAFVRRRLQERGCRGLILLGDDTAGWLRELDIALPVITANSTHQMLQHPPCKAAVWRALRALCD
ncbi:MAG: hypothetical protein AAGA91_18235 [Pseudomonadota bacterium]